MKYLVKFENLNSIDKKVVINNVANILSDILLEIEDMNYFTNVDCLYSCNSFFDIEIAITRDIDTLSIILDEHDDYFTGDIEKNIDLHDIEYVIDRIMDFSKLNGYLSSYFNINDIDSNTILEDSLSILNSSKVKQDMNIRKLNILLSFGFNI
jgi:hypothetical protein